MRDDGFGLEPLISSLQIMLVPRPTVQDLPPHILVHALQQLVPPISCAQLPAVSAFSQVVGVGKHTGQREMDK